jgi:hypothetical protein
VAQRLAVGAEARATESQDWLAVPQVPATGAPAREAVQDAVVPPFDPAQVQVTEAPAAGKAGEAGEAVPGAQKVPL